ncbi:MAG: ATP-binding protein [Clostridia bacterium]|nr:ATP-binding protein [Clostridia bacterium]
MRYKNSTVRKAAQELQRRRNQAELDAAVRKSEVFRKSPEAQDLDRQIAAAPRSFASIMLLRDKAEIERRIAALRRESMQYRRQLEELLVALGYPADYLDVHYTCENCHDTGSRDGEMCDCFKQLIKSTAYAELCAASPLDVCAFSDFDLRYYPDNDGGSGMSSRAVMQTIYEYCRSYAEDFSADSPNLLMYGRTGLGKTHLSLAIAGEVIERGFGVIYDSCPNIVSRLEDEKFGRADGEEEAALLDCDLLILDDLGAEFSTQFTKSAIYNIINTRLLKRLPTIISTNLGIEEIQEKYTERIASRLIGEYVIFRFAGKDIRQLKR